MNKWVNGQIISVKNWTKSLFTLIIKAPIFPFTAGQFTKISLEDKNTNRIQRAYSFLNAPNNEYLEFYIIASPSGQLSPKLQNLHPGNKVNICSQASGFFILNEIPDCEILWMVATGTAIGPYLSILQDKKENLKRFKKIFLVYAVRYTSDLSYLTLIQDLCIKYEKKLFFQSIVSRETNNFSLFGRIPDLLRSGILENKFGTKLHPNTSHVMLCGNPNMVRDTKNILQNTKNMRMNLRRLPGHITVEHYW